MRKARTTKSNPEPTKLSANCPIESKGRVLNCLHAKTTISPSLHRQHTVLPLRFPMRTAGLPVRVWSGYRLWLRTPPPMDRWSHQVAVFVVCRWSMRLCRHEQPLLTWNFT